MEQTKKGAGKMKNALMVMALIGLMASPVMAHTPPPTPPVSPTVINNEINDSDGLAVGFGFDAPKLIQITENNFIGAEAWGTDNRSKVFHQTMNENDVTALVKWVYTGTLFSFGGK